MVAGQNAFEVINLDESKPNMNCHNLPFLSDLQLNNFPVLPGPALFDLYFSPRPTSISGLLFQKKLPIVCGQNNFPACHYLCFSYENGNWNLLANFPECRERSQLTTLHLKNNLTNKLEESLVIFSENSPNVITFNGNTWKLKGIPPILPVTTTSPVISTTPTTNLQTTPTTSPPPPTPIIPLGKNCIARINETFLMFIGGVGNETFFFDSVQNIIIPGPNLNYNRRWPRCGVMNWKNPQTGELQKVIITVGGIDRGQNYYYYQQNWNSWHKLNAPSVELLFINDNDILNSQWTIGPPIPKVLSPIEIVEYQNGVIAVGGAFFEVADSFHVYKLASPNGKWVPIQKSYKEAKLDFFSLLLPDESADCY